jgi:hypothetical protein
METAAKTLTPVYGNGVIEISAFIETVMSNKADLRKL